MTAGMVLLGMCLTAMPAWAHEGEAISTTLWAAIGLGAVMTVAYGVSWGVVRPLVGSDETEGYLQRARAENAGMKAVLDRSGPALLLVDADGRIVWANAAWRRGWPRGEWAAGGAVVRELGRSIQSEQEYAKRTGAAVPLEIAGTPLLLEPLAGLGAVLRLEEADRAVQQVGSLRFDIQAGCAFVGDRRLDLSPTEYRLLAYLARHCGRVVTRQVLLREVWGHIGRAQSRTVDTHIRRLRDKLATASHLIETVRGQGYRLGQDAGQRPAA